MAPKKPHIYFLPVMAPGHMIPMLDLARQLSRLGAKSTIITTPRNALHFSEPIHRDAKNGSEISMSIIPFPTCISGLPDDCENLSSTTTLEATIKFFKALDFLQEPVERLIQEGDDPPDCFVAGAFFWWAIDVAKLFNIPRILFYGTGFFPMCIYRTLKENKDYENAETDFDEFVIRGLPDEIKMSRKQIPDEIKEGENSLFKDTIEKIVKSESESYGMIVNSFEELESDYAQHFKKIVGIKAWKVGPLSILNRTTEDRVQRGFNGDSSGVVDQFQKCLEWLNSKKPSSVIYVCFGSMAILSESQVLEIARGLESSGHDFIWVVGKKRVEEEDEEGRNDQWLGFVMRMEDQRRGLVVDGWAPQVMILEHEAVGGFVTHCGWNSVMEAVAAGVAMVTWPLSAEQFFNEKLVVEKLGIGVPVGVGEWVKRTEMRAPVEWGRVAAAVRRLMGEEGVELRRKVSGLKEFGMKAVEEGGSSAMDMRSFIEEIRVYRQQSSIPGG